MHPGSREKGNVTLESQLSELISSPIAAYDGKGKDSGSTQVLCAFPCLL